MKHHVHIQAQSPPELIERLFRVIRHRGFLATECHFQQESNETQIKVTVSSQRSISLLINQLRKQWGVIDVQCQSISIASDSHDELRTIS